MNIIDRIIEIDSLAQKRLRQAKSEKEAIENETIEICNQTKIDIDEQTIKSIAEIEKTQNSIAEQQKQNIKAQTDKKIDSLKNIYEQNHKTIEKEIFEEIINANKGSGA